MDVSDFISGQGVQLQQKAFQAFGAQVDEYMRDSGLGLAAGSITNSIMNGGSGFTGALRQAGQNVVGEAINSATSGVFGVISQGTDNTTGAPNYASDTLIYAPKQKFIFKVMFSFNDPYNQRIGQEFTYGVKMVDRPKINFEYEDVNMYNFKTKVLRAIRHEPLSMTSYDDIQNKVMDFFEAYRQAYSPISRGGVDPVMYEDSGMSFVPPGAFGSSASLGPLENGNINVLRSLSITQVYANGQRANVFQFVNPRIESFDFDTVDHEDSQGNMITCQFSYDALLMLDGTPTGTPMTNWGAYDILGNTPGGIAPVANQNLPSQSAIASQSSSGGSSGTTGLDSLADVFGVANSSGVVNSAISPIVAQMKNSLLDAKGLVNQAVAGVNTTVNDIQSQIKTVAQDTASSFKSDISDLFG